jgi:hypothetical protein
MKSIKEQFATFTRLIGAHCPHSSETISRNQKYSSIIECPSCQQKVLRNKYRLIVCYTGVFFLAVSIFLEEGYQWPFQLLFLVLLSTGFSMKELVKYQQ